MDRRLVEIPEPLDGESFDAYLDRLVVLSDQSLGVPPPIIVPGPPASSGCAGFKLVVTANNGNANSVGLSCLRLNNSGLATDNLPVVPGPVSSRHPSNYDDGVLRTLPMGATMGHTSDGNTGSPGDMWFKAGTSQTYVNNIGALHTWEYVGTVPPVTWLGLRSPSVVGATPKDFSLWIDGALRLSVTGWSPAAYTWGWWAI